jgi:hypothetical protein
MMTIFLPARGGLLKFAIEIFLIFELKAAIGLKKSCRLADKIMTVEGMNQGLQG